MVPEFIVHLFGESEMKHTLAVALAALTATFATASFAAPFSIADLLAATKIANDDFAAANPLHAPHWTGYKAWKSGDESKIKIYVDHNGAPLDFNFLCHKHDGNIECHAQ